MAETYNSTVRRDKGEDPYEKQTIRKALLPGLAIDGRAPQSQSDSTPSGIAKRNAQQAAAGIIGAPGTPALPPATGGLLPDANRDAGAWHGPHSWEPGYSGTAYGAGVGRGYAGSRITGRDTPIIDTAQPTGAHIVPGSNGEREAYISARGAPGTPGRQQSQMVGFSRQVPVGTPDRGMLAATGLPAAPQMSRITDPAAFDKWYPGNNVAPAAPVADAPSGNPGPLAFDFGAGSGSNIFGIPSPSATPVAPQYGPPSQAIPSATPPPTPRPPVTPTPPRITGRDPQPAQDRDITDPYWQMKDEARSWGNTIKGLLTRNPFLAVQ